MSSNTLESLSHALAGASGGVIAMALLYPLENVRTRLQVQVKKKEPILTTNNKQPAMQNNDVLLHDNIEYKNSLDCIYKVIEREGISGLYRGLHSALFGVGVSNAVYFYWYNTLKKLLLEYQQRSTLLPMSNLGVASVAGILNVFCTHPIWVINTRATLAHKQHKNKSMIEICSDIINEEGYTALYKGLIPSLILVSNPAIQFVVYEQLIRVLQKRNNNSTLHLTVTQYFVLGAIAKAAATVLTYPYQVVKSREQALRGKSSINTWQLILRIYREEGILAFFNGMPAKMSQTVTNSAFMFTIYERLVRIILLLLQAMLAEKTKLSSNATQLAAQATK